MSEKDLKITDYEIIEKEKVTHNTNRYRFKIPEGAAFEYLPGDHIKLYPDKSDPVEFANYTLTSTPDIKEHFELIIKHYPNGVVSKYMLDKKTGDWISISGPHSGGHFTDGMAGRIGMIAGGTGITPMISIIRSILGRGLDVEISLLFANKTIDDIIIKEELDKYASEKNNFKRYYVLSSPPPDWGMGAGRIDADLIREKMPPPSDDTIIFICGPPLMQLDMHKKALEQGYAKDKLIIP